MFYLLFSTDYEPESQSIRLIILSLINLLIYQLNA